MICCRTSSGDPWMIVLESTGIRTSLGCVVSGMSVDVVGVIEFGKGVLAVDGAGDSGI